MRTSRYRRRILVYGFGGLLFILLIQLIPYGREHVNLPLTREPQWDSPRTRELFFKSCRDCHSNETKWPWYSSIAPASWLVQYDVNEGRYHFNVSEWDRGENEGSKAARFVRDGKMPLPYYLPAHPEARLSSDEKKELISGLAATFGPETAKEHTR